LAQVDACSRGRRKQYYFNIMMLNIGRDATRNGLTHARSPLPLVAQRRPKGG
jgi:hypothetical protein